MTDDTGAPDKDGRASVATPRAQGSDFMIGGAMLVGAVLLYLYLQNLPVVPAGSEAILGKRFVTESCRSLGPFCLSEQASGIAVIACVVIAVVGLIFIAKGIFKRST